MQSPINHTLLHSLIFSAVLGLFLASSAVQALDLGRLTHEGFRGFL